MSPRNHLSSRHIHKKPTGLEHLSDAELDARIQELEAMLPDDFPMPPTETDPLAYTERILREDKARLLQAEPMPPAKPIRKPISNVSSANSKTPPYPRRSMATS